MNNIIKKNYNLLKKQKKPIYKLISYKNNQKILLMKKNPQKMNLII